MFDTNLENISDEMTGRRRLSAMFKLTERLTTEDIELLNAVFPRLAECALHEFLNPEPQTIWDVSELRRMLGVTLRRTRSNSRTRVAGEP